MRAALREMLLNDEAIRALGFDHPESILNAQGVDTPGFRPFIVIRWQNVIPAFGMVGQQSVAIWVHDEPGDYARIDDTIVRINYLCSNLVHQEGSDGSTISAMTWRGDSDDLFDDGYKTITRNTSFSAAGR